MGLKYEPSSEPLHISTETGARESPAPVAVLSLPPVKVGLPGAERGGVREAVGTNNETRDDGTGGGTSTHSISPALCAIVIVDFT